MVSYYLFTLYYVFYCFMFYINYIFIVPTAFVLSFLIFQIIAFAMSTKDTIYISRPIAYYSIIDLKTDLYA